MRLPRLFRTVDEHPSSKVGKGSERVSADRGLVSEQDIDVDSRTGGPSSPPKKTQIEVEISPGVIFRSNPSMLISMSESGEKKITPLTLDKGRWKNGLQGAGRSAYLDSKISDKINEAFAIHIGKVIVE